MKLIHDSNLLIITLITILSALYTNVHAEEAIKLKQIKNKIMLDMIYNDHKNFYTFNRLSRLGLAFGIGAAMANSEIDTQIPIWYQKHMKSDDSDHFSGHARFFGERNYMIPFAALTASLSFLDDTYTLGSWGKNTSRAYLLGAPVLLFSQAATGASRPDEVQHGSKWSPFNDNNGVSGHSFIGAVPFLTLAKMNNDNKPVQYLAFAASFASAYSRVNDNKHYLSQAALGWYLAYETVDSIFDTNNGSKNISVSPMINTKGSYGISISKKW